jgi:hypothetical protein
MGPIRRYHALRALDPGTIIDEPDRYAVQAWSYRGSDEKHWTTCGTLDEVKEEIVVGQVSRVVDLDTGADIPFTHTVSVSIREQGEEDA